MMTTQDDPSPEAASFCCFTTRKLALCKFCKTSTFMHKALSLDVLYDQ
jgi:hypothetical protein